MSWETAYAIAYEIQVSDDKKRWETVSRVEDGDGGEDSIRFAKPAKARYVRMRGLKRATEWGYSLWEFKVLLN